MENRKADIKNRNCNALGKSDLHSTFPAHFKDCQVTAKLFQEASDFKGFTKDEFRVSSSGALHSKYRVLHKEKKEKELECDIFSEEGLTCPKCLLTFSWEAHLNHHQTFCNANILLPGQIHLNSEHEELLRETVSGMLSCPWCPLLCSNIRILQKHLTLCKEVYRNRNRGQIVEKLPCPECPDNFSALKQLLMHLQLHYIGDLSCSPCRKQFISIDLLSKHLLNCVSDKFYKCSDCSRLFINASSLQSHLASCRSFIQCLKCSEVIVERASCMDHMLLHLTAEWAVKGLEMSDGILRKVKDAEKRISHFATAGSQNEFSKISSANCSTFNLTTFQKSTSAPIEGKSKSQGKFDFMKVLTSNDNTSFSKKSSTNANHNALKSFNLANTLPLFELATKQMDPLEVSKHSLNSKISRDTDSSRSDHSVENVMGFDATSDTLSVSSTSDTISGDETFMNEDEFSLVQNEEFVIENDIAEPNTEEQGDITSFVEEPQLHLDQIDPRMEENFDQTNVLLLENNRETSDLFIPAPSDIGNDQEDELTLTVVNVEGGANLFNWDESDNVVEPVLENDTCNHHPTIEESGCLEDVPLKENVGITLNGAENIASDGNEDRDSGIGGIEDKDCNNVAEDLNICQEVVISSSTCTNESVVETMYETDSKPKEKYCPMKEHAYALMDPLLLYPPKPFAKPNFAGAKSPRKSLTGKRGKSANRKSSSKKTRKRVRPSKSQIKKVTPRRGINQKKSGSASSSSPKKNTKLNVEGCSPMMTPLQGSRTEESHVEKTHLCPKVVSPSSVSKNVTPETQNGLPYDHAEKSVKVKTPSAIPRHKKEKMRMERKSHIPFLGDCSTYGYLNLQALQILPESQDNKSFEPTKNHLDAHRTPAAHESQLIPGRFEPGCKSQPKILEGNTGVVSKRSGQGNVSIAITSQEPKSRIKISKSDMICSSLSDLPLNAAPEPQCPTSPIDSSVNFGQSPAGSVDLINQPNPSSSKDISTPSHELPKNKLETSGNHPQISADSSEKINNTKFEETQRMRKRELSMLSHGFTPMSPIKSQPKSSSLSIAGVEEANLKETPELGSNLAKDEQNCLYRLPQEDHNSKSALTNTVPSTMDVLEEFSDFCIRSSNNEEKNTLFPQDDDDLQDSMKSAISNIVDMLGERSDCDETSAKVGQDDAIFTSQPPVCPLVSLQGQINESSSSQVMNVSREPRVSDKESIILTNSEIENALSLVPKKALSGSRKKIKAGRGSSLKLPLLTECNDKIAAQREKSMLLHGFKPMATKPPTSQEVATSSHERPKVQKIAPKRKRSSKSINRRNLSFSKSTVHDGLMFVVSSDGDLLPHPNFNSQVCPKENLLLSENMAFVSPPAPRKMLISPLLHAQNQVQTTPSLVLIRKESNILKPTGTTTVRKGNCKDYMKLSQNNDLKNKGTLESNSVTVPGHQGFCLPQSLNLNSKVINKVIEQTSMGSKSALLKELESSIPNLNNYNVFIMSSDDDSEEESSERTCNLKRSASDLPLDTFNCSEIVQNKPCEKIDCDKMSETTVCGYKITTEGCSTSVTSVSESALGPTSKEADVPTSGHTHLDSDALYDSSHAVPINLAGDTCNSKETNNSPNSKVNPSKSHFNSSSAQPVGLLDCGSASKEDKNSSEDKRNSANSLADPCVKEAPIPVLNEVGSFLNVELLPETRPIDDSIALQEKVTEWNSNVEEYFESVNTDYSESSNSSDSRGPDLHVSDTNDSKHLNSSLDKRLKLFANGMLHEDPQEQRNSINVNTLETTGSLDSAFCGNITASEDIAASNSPDSDLLSGQSMDMDIANSDVSEPECTFPKETFVGKNSLENHSDGSMDMDIANSNSSEPECTFSKETYADKNSRENLNDTSVNMNITNSDDAQPVFAFVTEAFVDKNSKKSHNVPHCSKILPQKVNHKKLSCFQLSVNPTRKLMFSMTFLKKRRYGREGKYKNNNSGIFNCSSCSQWFYSDIDLDSHKCLKAMLLEKFTSESFDKFFEISTKVEDGRGDQSLNNMSPYENYIRMKTFMKKRHFACDKCKTTCKSFSALLEHKATIHSEISPLICHICNKQFDHLQKLAVHVAKRHKNNDKLSESEKCIKMDEVVANTKLESVSLNIVKNLNENTLAENSETHFTAFDETKHPSYDISTRENSKAGDGMYIKEERKDSVEMNLVKNEAVDSSAQNHANHCSMCNRTFRFRGGLKSHINQAHSNGIRCPLCARKFTFLKSMQKHYLVCHSSSNESQINKESSEPVFGMDSNITECGGISSEGEKKAKSLSSGCDFELQGNKLTNLLCHEKKHKKAKWRMVVKDDSAEGKRGPDNVNLMDDGEKSGELGISGRQESSRPLIVSFSKVRASRLKCCDCNKSFRKESRLALHRDKMHRQSSVGSPSKSQQEFPEKIDQCGKLNFVSQEFPNKDEEQVSPDDHKSATIENKGVDNMISFNTDNITPFVTDPNKFQALEKSGHLSPEAQISSSNANVDVQLLPDFATSESKLTVPSGNQIKSKGLELKRQGRRTPRYQMFSETLHKKKVRDPVLSNAMVDKKKWKCEDCKKEFRTKGFLERHNIRNHGAPCKFNCPHCGNGFTDYRSLRFHHKTKHRRKKWLIQDEGVKMNSPQPASTEPCKPFDCDVDGVADNPFDKSSTSDNSKSNFDLGNVKQVKVKPHEGKQCNEAVPKTFQCPLCEINFATKELFMNHFSDIHIQKDSVSMQSTPAVPPSPQDTQHESVSRCGNDEEVTSQISKIKSMPEPKDNLGKKLGLLNCINDPELLSSSEHSNTLALSCTNVPGDLKAETPIAAHKGIELKTGDSVSSMHNASKMKKSNKRKFDKMQQETNGCLAEETEHFKCEDCPLSYRVYSCLKRHRILVHNEKAEFYCSICGKGFSYPHSLKNHVMTHSRGQKSSSRPERSMRLKEEVSSKVEMDVKETNNSSEGIVSPLNSINVKNVEPHKSSLSPNNQEVSSKGAANGCSFETVSVTSVNHSQVPENSVSNINNLSLETEKFPQEISHVKTETLMGQGLNYSTHQQRNCEKDTNSLSYADKNSEENLCSRTVGFCNQNHETVTYPAQIKICERKNEFSSFNDGFDSFNSPNIAQPAFSGSAVYCVPELNDGASFTALTPRGTAEAGLSGKENEWATSSFPEGRRTDLWPCTICGLSFHSWHVLQEHHHANHITFGYNTQVEHALQNWYNPPLPQTALSGYSTLHGYEGVNNGWNTMPYFTPASISQDKRTEETKSLQELTSHNVVHCTVCGMCFPSLYSLQEHYKTHLVSPMNNHNNVGFYLY